MMGHKICFSEEIWPIIPKLSLLLLLIWSPDSGPNLLFSHEAIPSQSSQYNQMCSNSFGDKV